MKNNLLWSALLSLFILFTSCDNGRYESIMLEDSDLWSLMDVKNGEIVAEDEFFAPPTKVVKGSFFVENKSGKFNLYNINDTKNRLNPNGYSIISNFNKDGYAIVRVKDEPWQIINPKGETLTTLNKNMVVLSGFSDDGLARFANKKGQVGYFNTKGEVVIKPRYIFGTVFSDGVAFVLNKQENNVNFFLAINTKGETLYRFSDAKYTGMTLYKEGYCFAVDQGNVILLDKDGKKVMKVSKANDMANFLTIHDKKVTYFDGEYFGVKDLNGSIVIRAKYRVLQFLEDGNLIAINTSNQYGVINTKDETVVPFDYPILEYVAPGRYITKSSNVDVLIDNAGKEIGRRAFTDYISTSFQPISRQFDLILSRDATASEYSESITNYFQNLINSTK